MRAEQLRSFFGKEAEAGSLSPECLADLFAYVQLQTGLAVFQTADGSALVTPEQLTEDVCAVLRERGGRVAVAELAAACGVPLKPCVEDAVARACAARDDLHVVAGDLVGGAYVDALVGRMAAELSGIATLQDVAAEHRLQPALLSRHVDAAIAAGTLGAIHEGGAVYTHAFAAQQKSDTDAAIAAVACPTPLEAIAKASGIRSSLFHQRVDELVAEGALPGTIQGGSRGVYTPSSFEAERARAVAAAFSQTHWVSYRSVRAQYSVQNAQQWLPSVVGQECIALPSVYVSESFLHSLLPAIECADRQEGGGARAINLAEVLPAAFSEEDVARLAESWFPQHVAGYGTSFQRFAGTWFVSRAAVAAVVDRIRSDAPGAVRRRVAEIVRAGGSIQALSDGPPRRGKRKARDEDADPDRPSLVNVDAVRKALRKGLKVPEDACGVEELLEAVAADVKPAVVAAHEAALADMQMDDSQRAAKKRQDAEDRMHELWQWLLAEVRMLPRLAAADGPLRHFQGLQPHFSREVCRTLGSEFVRQLLRITELQAGLADGALSGDGIESAKQELATLPAVHRDPVLAVLEAMERPDPAASLVEEAERQSLAMGVGLRQARQRGEREARAQRAASLRAAAITAELDSGSAAELWGSLLAALLWQHSGQRILVSRVPEAAAPAAAAALREMLPEEAAAAVDAAERALRDESDRQELMRAMSQLRRMGLTE